MARRSLPSRRALRRSRSVRAALDSLLAEDVGALLDGFFGAEGCGVAEEAFDPCVDVREQANELVLSAELPGLERGDFEVIVDGDDVTLRGEKKIEPAAASDRCFRAERGRGSFSRTFRMPFEVEPEAVRCRFRNGLLTIAVPRLPDPGNQVRNVPVTTG